MRKRKAHDQAGLPLDDRFRNQGLFAGHFLKHRLPELPEWEAGEGLEDAFEAVKKLFEERAAQFTADTNEAQTENDFIRPVLDILWGHECYQVQAEIPNADARRVPDYAFFLSAEDRNAAHKRVGSLFLSRRQVRGRRGRIASGRLRARGASCGTRPTTYGQASRP